MDSLYGFVVRADGLSIHRDQVVLDLYVFQQRRERERATLVAKQCLV